MFTSPSSVDRAPKATRSGNARLHGMTKVSAASLAYIATQVCSWHCWPEIKLTATVIKHRYGSYYRRRPSSRERIQKPTRDGFITVFWIFWKTPRNKKTSISYCCFGTSTQLSRGDCPSSDWRFLGLFFRLIHLPRPSSRWIVHWHN